MHDPRQPNEKGTHRTRSDTLSFPKLVQALRLEQRLRGLTRRNGTFRDARGLHVRVRQERRKHAGTSGRGRERVTNAVFSTGGAEEIDR